MKYYCPVCLYPNLPFAPKDHNICPCCGTEFGYDDVSRKWEDLREQWISSGAKWFSDSTPMPPGWDAYTQLYGKISLLGNASSSTNEIRLGFAEPGDIRTSSSHA